MFDMNVVFERFVGQLFRRYACPVGHTVHLQDGSVSLLARHGNPCFSLRPDVMVRHGEGAVTCVVDTKWKRLDTGKAHRGLEADDVYQMYAYGKGLPATLVILLFPRLPGLQQMVDDYRHLLNMDSRILVRTVDVSRPTQLVVQELRQIISEAVGPVAA